MCISAGGTKVGTKFNELPFSTQWFHGRYATKEEKAERRNTIKSFMDGARVGNVYRTTGGGEYEIVSYNRSPNKMGIRSLTSGRSVALSSANVEKYFRKGAKMVRRNKKEKSSQLSLF